MALVKSTIKAAGSAAFLGTTVMLAGLILYAQFPELRDGVSAVRCVAGFPQPGSECVARKLAALEDERRALDEERERLGDVIAAQSFVFTQGDQLKDGINLVVGTLYADAASRASLIRSFCWAIVDSGGLDPRVGLAVLHGDGRIEDVAVRADDLALLEMSAGEVEAARAACPFPGVS